MLQNLSVFFDLFRRVIQCQRCPSTAAKTLSMLCRRVRQLWPSWSAASPKVAGFVRRPLLRPDRSAAGLAWASLTLSEGDATRSGVMLPEGGGGWRRGDFPDSFVFQEVKSTLVANCPGLRQGRVSRRGRRFCIPRRVVISMTAWN